ncbi:MAG: hypothetical protein H6862_04555 [Rhodospirillales bacterium]|nr:hypothetical protein [Rhodospirillales bacterium]
MTQDINEGIERGRAGQMRNAARDWGGSSPIPERKESMTPSLFTVPARPSAPLEDTSFRGLLKTMGEPEFRRIIDDAMRFERSKAALPEGRGFVTGNGESSAPAPFEAKIALCKACRESIATRGVEATEDLIFKILDLENKLARQTPPSGAGGPLDVESLVEKHWAACVDAPSQVDAKIDRIDALEKSLSGMEKADPSLVGAKDNTPRSMDNEWAPKAHEFRVEQDKKMGRPVDEAALASARDSSFLYRCWRAAVRVLGGDTPSKTQALPERVAQGPSTTDNSAPPVVRGRIKQVKPGVFEVS